MKDFFKPFNFNFIILLNPWSFIHRCCAAERESFLITVGEKEDSVQPIPEIIKSALHYYLGAKKIDLTHDIEHCTQPAATFLLKIKILEERRKTAYLGRDQWINF